MSEQVTIRHVLTHPGFHLFSLLKQATQHKRKLKTTPSIKPMPRARALALARVFKRWIAVASLATFSIFGGLVVYPQIYKATTQTHQPSSPVHKVLPAKSPVSSQKSHSFFKQQEGNNLGSQSASQETAGGYSSSSQTPISEYSNTQQAPASGYNNYSQAPAKRYGNTSQAPVYGGYDSEPHGPISGSDVS